MTRYANDVVFVLGLAVLVASVARWSPAAAGIVLGVVLMTIAAWPLLTRRKPE